MQHNFPTSNLHLVHPLYRDICAVRALIYEKKLFAATFDTGMLARREAIGNDEIVISTSAYPKQRPSTIYYN